jgi:exonuclease VII large subunit
MLTVRTQSCDPQVLLRRGLAIVRDVEGRVLRQASRVQAGQGISVQLQEGSLSALVERVDAGTPTARLGDFEESR